MTVLFADIAGSTALADRLDPERLRAVLRDYFEAMASVIEAWGGSVEKFIGDAVMAVFGIPAAREDDPVRALHAALEMQRRLEIMNLEFADRHHVQLSIRIGVDTGEVVAGRAKEFMVTGDAVNVAARLQQAARSGEAVVGERTHRLARKEFAFQPLPGKTVKGKEAPVQAWRLLRPTEPMPTGKVLELSAPLVGRDREMAVLKNLYRTTVRQGQPRLVGVLGPAGIGKTRLLEEFLLGARFSDSPPAVYRGRCLPYGQGITYWALREIVWSAAGIHLGDPASHAEAKLRQLSLDLFGSSGDSRSEAEGVMYALATTTGLALPDNPLNRMSPQSVGEELGLAWPRFIGTLAARRPTVLVVEDLHWAEPPLLDMLERVVAGSAAGVLIVVSARPEFLETLPDWGTERNMFRLRLEPLRDPDGRELLSNLVPDVSQNLRDRILQVAEGNPFFAEEIIHHLIDSQVLQRRDGGLIESRADTPVEIPDSIRAVLAARIDALPGAEKKTLQDAAVVGRTFWATTLDAIRGDGPVDEALAGLEQRGLIVRSPRSSLPGHTELSFRHGLIREVAYQSILRGRRARTHDAVGRWIEDLAGKRRDEFVDLLAHHFTAAAQPEDAELAWPTDPPRREGVRAKAVQALLDAGWAARSRFAIDQAVGFADRALALTTSDVERLGALELKARSAHAAVRVDDAWSVYLEALETARRAGDVEALSRLRAYATLLWSRYGGAFATDDWKPRGLEIVQEGLNHIGEDASSFEAAALLAGRATFGFWQVAPSTPEKAHRDADRAIRIASAIESPELLSYALDALAVVSESEGFCGSGTMANRTLRVVPRIADRVEAHEMLVTASLAFSDAGRFRQAIVLAEDAARQALQLGPHHRIHAASAQTSCLVPTGRLVELLEATANVGDLVADEGGHTCIRGTWALAGRALALFEAGRRREALDSLDLLDRATPKNAISLPWRVSRTAEILRPVMGLDAARGRLEEAGDEEAIASRIWRLRAELPIRALTGERELFHELAAEARALAEPACAPYLVWIADWGEGALLVVNARPDEGLSMARSAISSLEAYGESYTAARLLVDVLPFLDPDPARTVADEVVARLESMAAIASAQEARNTVKPG